MEVTLINSDSHWFRWMHINLALVTKGDSEGISSHFKITHMLGRWHIPWTYDLVIITTNYHWGKVTKSRHCLGELIFMWNIIYTNGGFCHLVWKMPLQNFKGRWIGCWQTSTLPNVTLMMTSLLSTQHKGITSIIYRRYLEDLKVITLNFT